MVDKIKNDWWQFHKANPQVWETFCIHAFRAIRKGKTKISARLIIEVIRWEHYIETDDPNSTFKINNNYIAMYARYFMFRYPRHNNVFQIRERKLK